MTPGADTVRIAFRCEGHRGGHTDVGVFVGANPGSRGKGGQIVVRNSEWLEMVASNRFETLDSIMHEGSCRDAMKKAGWL